MNIFEISPRDYHQRLTCNRANVRAADSFLSKSVLWELDSSSLYKWRFHKEEKTITDAIEWGSLVDCLATTPELAATDIVVNPFDSYRTNDAKKWREEQRAEKRIITTKEDFAAAHQAVKMLRETCRASADIFAKSTKQVIIAGLLHGVKIKGLVDLAPEGEDFLADLKTTATFSLEGFAKRTASLGYHMQAGIYLNLWNAMFPHDQRTRWKLIWQDEAAPYEACVTELDPNDIEAGWSYADKLVQRILEATDSNHWPMAFEGERIVTRPTWAAMQEEAKLAA